MMYGYNNRFAVTLSNQPFNESEQMKRSELDYRKHLNGPDSTRRRTNQPNPSGSLNDDTEERIVLLYTSGQSVESITREVGRARHRIVHILQARGVFGNSQTGANCEEPKSESLTVEEPKEELTIEERRPKPPTVKELGPEIPTEEPARKPKRPRKSESPQNLKSMATEKARPAPPGLPKPDCPDRWSPLVLESLCKVIMQLDLYPGMNLEEVHTMLSDWNR
jgi:hypothetical protein